MYESGKKKKNLAGDLSKEKYYIIRSMYENMENKS